MKIGACGRGQRGTPPSVRRRAALPGPASGRTRMAERLRRGGGGEMRAELTAEEQALLEQARGAAAGAFAPYSRFRVGAALRSADGRVFRGANVESASYGLTMCA